MTTTRVTSSSSAQPAKITTQKESFLVALIAGVFTAVVAGFPFQTNSADELTPAWMITGAATFTLTFVVIAVANKMTLKKAS